MAASTRWATVHDLYDLAGRTLAGVNPLNQRSTTVYDAAGQGVGRIDPLGRRAAPSTTWPVGASPPLTR